MFEVGVCVYCVVETADRNVSGSSGASLPRTGYLISGWTDFVLLLILTFLGAFKQIITTVVKLHHETGLNQSPISVDCGSN